MPMIINEIDYDQSLKYIQDSIDQISEGYVSGQITKDDALSRANDLRINLNFEVQLSDLTLEQKAEITPLFIMIKLLIREISDH